MLAYLVAALLGLSTAMGYVLYTLTQRRRSPQRKTHKTIIHEYTSPEAKALQRDIQHDLRHDGMTGRHSDKKMSSGKMSEKGKAVDPTSVCAGTPAAVCTPGKLSTRGNSANGRVVHGLVYDDSDNEDGVDIHASQQHEAASPHAYNYPVGILTVAERRDSSCVSYTPTEHSYRHSRLSRYHGASRDGSVVLMRSPAEEIVRVRLAKRSKNLLSPSAASHTYMHDGAAAHSYMHAGSAGQSLLTMRMRLLALSEKV
jgi:hypothetical protein